VIAVTRMRSLRLTGFSLVELMIVVGLVATLFALAAPAFGGLIQRQRVESASDALQAGIALARVEAVRRGQRVEVRPLPCDRGGWNCGWAVGVAGTTAVIRTVEVDPTLTLERLSGSGAYVVGPRAGAGAVRFRFAAGPSASPVEHFLCHTAAGGFRSTRVLTECDDDA
jgi:Tfp pilus assembly protein FimT